MSKREQFGQLENPERSKNNEGSVESREQFGDRALRAAQDVYANEVKALEEKTSKWENLKNLGYTLAVPGGLYTIGKFFGVDEAMGLSVSESVDAAIRLSWGTAMLGAGCATFVEMHFGTKLNHLKEKFGILSKPEDKETE